MLMGEQEQCLEDIDIEVNDAELSIERTGNSRELREACQKVELLTVLNCPEGEALERRST
jgi:hypothetical protein